MAELSYVGPQYMPIELTDISDEKCVVNVLTIACYYPRVSYLNNGETKARTTHIGLVGDHTVIVFESVAEITALIDSKYGRPTFTFNEK